MMAACWKSGCVWHKSVYREVGFMDHKNYTSTLLRQVFRQIKKQKGFLSGKPFMERYS
jgi:hypothetical protein